VEEKTKWHVSLQWLGQQVIYFNFMPVDKEYASLCFPAEFCVKVLAICNFVHLEKEKL
jgi:hypothetical protein